MSMPIKTIVVEAYCSGPRLGNSLAHLGHSLDPIWIKTILYCNVPTCS